MLAGCVDEWLTAYISIYKSCSALDCSRVTSFASERQFSPIRCVCLSEQAVSWRSLPVFQHLDKTVSGEILSRSRNVSRE